MKQHIITLAVAAATAAMVVAAPAPAQAATLWGAIAVDDDGTAWPTANLPTAEAAEADAKAYCGGRRGCDVLVTFADGCGAVAWSDEQWHGGHGATLAAAQESALRLNGGGTIQAWVCTDGHG
ncbi:DUF4189 domain-containing protein [Tsukamurella sp. DT100]|uniref:DUF4189 domain-containing protein n=1 Tax=Tsukamurella sp. DT100 TaxID=3393415 RepID=UPI003CE98150